MKFYKKEEYVYRDLHFGMATNRMANILYAGIMTDAAFTILWTLSGKEYTRKQNSRNGAVIKVHIHPELIDKFEQLTGEILQVPPQIQMN